MTIRGGKRLLTVSLVLFVLAVLRPEAVTEGGGARAEPAAKSIAGRWLVRQKCDTGNFEIALTINQSSPTAFTGTSQGLSTGASSQIVGGRIAGTTVTFTRQGGKWTDRWTAQLKSADTLAGTSVGPSWRCSYTAVRS